MKNFILGLGTGAIALALIIYSQSISPAEAKVEFFDYSRPTSTTTTTPTTTTKSYNVIVTCYTASPDETDDTPFITADGTDLRKTKDKVIAANWLPFGTKVQIEGVEYVVRDRMNKRYGKPHVDILVKTKAEAFKCKRKQVLTI
jgi:3D (Asp-Asp-Asp) domain-containing protein